MPHIHDLKVENDVLKGQVNDLKSENGALKTNLDNLRKDVKTMQNSLSQMSTMLTERSHFESGKLEAGVWRLQFLDRTGVRPDVFKHELLLPKPAVQIHYRDQAVVDAGLCWWLF